MNISILIFIATIVTGQLVLSIRSLSKKTAKQDRGAEILIDTCALIDGRILDLAKTGFLTGTLVVPQFVVAELQGLADGGNNLKRQRARYGLDMIQQLQSPRSRATVEIAREPVDSQTEVDDKLVELAKSRNAYLYTTDYNLNKVAEIEGITVLNVNELSQLLRPNYLPGESGEVKIVQKGQGKGQGVGYLEDGTMVVVDNASRYIGKSISVEFDRHLQTDSGRMMFAKRKA